MFLSVLECFLSVFEWFVLSVLYILECFLRGLVRFRVFLVGFVLVLSVFECS